MGDIPNTTAVDSLETSAERKGVQEVRVPTRPDGFRTDWGKVLAEDGSKWKIVDPAEEAKKPTEKKDPNAAYALVGGFTHVAGGSSYTDHNGKERDYADHAESLKIQQFVTPYISYVVGTNYNNYLNGKSTLFSLCGEVSRFGMCAGVEHGLEGDIPDDKLINGSLSLKYEAYRTFDISGGLWGLLEKGTELKTGVESVITPGGETRPMLNAEIRVPLKPDDFNL